MKIERVWAMPSPATFTIKPIGDLLNRYIIKPEEWIDPFAGYNSPATTWTNDLNLEIPSMFHMDAVAFLEYIMREGHLWEGVLLDPPYSAHQSNQVYEGYGLRKPISLVKDLAAQVIQHGYYAVCCGHNTNGLGINRGFKLEEILVVAHGGSHDDTLVTVERKVI